MQKGNSQTCNHGASALIPHLPTVTDMYDRKEQLRTSCFFFRGKWWLLQPHSIDFPSMSWLASSGGAPLATPPSLCFSKRSTTSNLPNLAAQCRGVACWLSSLSLSAPISGNSCASSKLPSMESLCRAVLPPESNFPLSAPASSNKHTTSATFCKQM